MVGLLGKKLGQTRVYTKDGRAVSVTVVQAGPNHVLQRKTTEKDGYEAVQLGFDEQKEQRLSLAKRGHSQYSPPFSEGQSAAISHALHFGLRAEQRRRPCQISQ